MASTPDEGDNQQCVTNCNSLLRTVLSRLDTIEASIAELHEVSSTTRDMAIQSKETLGILESDVKQANHLLEKMRNGLGEFTKAILGYVQQLFWSDTGSGTAATFAVGAAA